MTALALGEGTSRPPERRDAPRPPAVALLTRRSAAAAVIALPMLVRAQARASGLRPTPAQTEGPFYPPALPADADADLLHNGALPAARGQPATVEGTLRGVDGRPLAGAMVEIWQCDAAGRYHHPAAGGRADPSFQGFGRVVVDADGRWRFRTLRPAPYTGRTPHVHVKVRRDGRELLTTQLYVAGDPGNERDFLWRRLDRGDRDAVTVPFVPSGDGVRAEFPIVVAA